MLPTVPSTLYLARGVLYLALGGQVGFVAHQQFVDALAGVALDFLEPALYIGKGIRVRHIVDDNDPVGASIVAAGNRAEALLPSRVPLQR